LTPALAALGLRAPRPPQALLESICQLLLGCVFDPIWRHRDLLAQPAVRHLVVALSRGQLLPAAATACVRLRQVLARPADEAGASFAWMLGSVARTFTGMCRCMKAVVEFESCEPLWAALGDAFTSQLAITHLVERFSATATAVHPSYYGWRPPPEGGGGGRGGGGGAGVAPGETYLGLCSAVEVFLE
ncbi:hypothetical protein TSOC_012267, partial [Tetrabaena socialis]